ncbi:MAG: hypothetical protein ABEI99_12290 [Halobaculum sp.]
MDRIAALRNVEDALRAFEEGEADLATTEREVATILRTFATEFDTEDRQVYRVRRRERESRVESDDGAESGAETVVVAESESAARERGAEFADVPPESVIVEPVGE